MKISGNNITERLIIIVALTCLMIFGQVNAAENWVAEEIFKQLDDLRSDNSKLRKDVEQLKLQLSKLKSDKSKPRIVSSVSMDDDPVMGKSDAKVAIVEFTDYQCPFCQRHSEQTLPKLKENYIDTGKSAVRVEGFSVEFS